MNYVCVCEGERERLEGLMTALCVCVCVCVCARVCSLSTDESKTPVKIFILPSIERIAANKAFYFP